MSSPLNVSTQTRENIPRAPLDREKELLGLVAKGDEPAFRQVYDHYRQRIYNLGMYLTRSEIMAEEMVQDVFMKTWENRLQLKKIDHFNAWLRTVAKNTASNYLRNLATERLALTRISARQGASNLVTEDTVTGREYDQILQESIRQLPAQQQKVYKLSRIEGMKQDEIAREMGISVYTVKEYMKLALRSIRKSLEDKIDVAIILALTLFLD
jgi:RNA polymerase sigma-70 factor (family 1)